MTGERPEVFQERLEEVRARLARAAGRGGRRPEDITLLAVSKTFPPELVRCYAALGLRDFGESYFQEAQAKIAALADQPGLNWHFIGRLQTNKAARAASLFSAVHSLDQAAAAEALNRKMESLGRRLPVYIQVNVSGEAAKSGLKPGDLPGFLEFLAHCGSLQPVGLMTMPPYDPDPEASRPHFAALRELRDRAAPHLPGLSMGMSGDFEVAAEEGATIVRVGTALFGSR